MPTERIWILIARKLTGEATENELIELHGLLCDHPNEHYTFDIIQEQWKHQHLDSQTASEKSFNNVWHKLQMQEVLNQLQPSQQEEPKESTELPEKPEKDNDLSGTIKKLGYLLAAAMLLTGGIWLFSSIKKQTPAPSKLDGNEVSTKFGSKTKLILPDSTQVWLNGGSKLTYSNNYGENFREVKLTGEAYFDVVHNAEKPFIIHTDKMDIKVLGTAFNVKCYPGEKSMETSLIRGSIEVTLKNRQSEKIMLKPNEKLVLNESETVSPKRILSGHKSITKQEEPIVAIQHITYDEQENTVLESSWVENKLMFRAESFEDLALQMERWYGVKINFLKEDLKRIKLTGIFKRETINQALAYLQLAARFHFTIDDQENINIY